MEDPLAELGVVGEEARHVQVRGDRHAQGGARSEQATRQRRRRAVVALASLAATRLFLLLLLRRRLQPLLYRPEQERAIRPVKRTAVSDKGGGHRTIAREPLDRVAEIPRLPRPPLLFSRERLQQRRRRVHAPPCRGRVLFQPRFGRHRGVERRARLVQLALHPSHPRVGRVFFSRRPPQLQLRRAQRRRLGLDHLVHRVVLAHGCGPVAQTFDVSGSLTGRGKVEVRRGEVGLEELDRLVVDRFFRKLQQRGQEAHVAHHLDRLVEGSFEDHGGSRGAEGKGGGQRGGGGRRSGGRVCGGVGRGRGRSWRHHRALRFLAAVAPRDRVERQAAQDQDGVKDALDDVRG